MLLMCKSVLPCSHTAIICHKSSLLLEILVQCNCFATKLLDSDAKACWKHFLFPFCSLTKFNNVGKGREVELKEETCCVFSRIFWDEVFKTNLTQASVLTFPLALTCDGLLSVLHRRCPAEASVTASPA